MARGQLDRIISVRYAQPSDADAIAATLRAAFKDFEAQYTPAGFAATTPAPAQISDRFHEGPIWVAESGGRVVGTVSVVARDDELYIRSMAVNPSARGQRIGTRLLRAIEALALSTGHHRLVLTTTSFLGAAIALYEREGFQRTGELTDLHGTPLLEMAKTLTPS